MLLCLSATPALGAQSGVTCEMDDQGRLYISIQQFARGTFNLAVDLADADHFISEFTADEEMIISMRNAKREKYERQRQQAEERRDTPIDRLTEMFMDFVPDIARPTPGSSFKAKSIFEKVDEYSVEPQDLSIQMATDEEIYELDPQNASLKIHPLAYMVFSTAFDLDLQLPSQVQDVDQRYIFGKFEYAGHIDPKTSLFQGLMFGCVLK